MLDKLIFIVKYLSEGRYLQVQDATDEVITTLLHRHFLNAILSVILVLAACLLFYFLSLKPLIRSLKKGFRVDASVFKSWALIFPIIIVPFAVQFSAPSLRQIGAPVFGAIAEKVIGSPPQFEPNQYCKVDRPLTECQAKRKAAMSQLEALTTQRPWQGLNEQTYRSIKNDLKDLHDCPEPTNENPENFAKCEEQLTEIERYRLSRALLMWAMLAAGLSLLFFLVIRPLLKRLQERLKGKAESSH